MPSPRAARPVDRAKPVAGAAERGLTPQDRLRGLVARDVMTREVVTVRADASLAFAANTMRQRRVSGLPVVDAQDRLVGVLSERDILADLDKSVGIGHVRGILDLLLEAGGHLQIQRLDQALRRLENAKVAEAMATRVVSVDADASVGETARLLRQFSIKRLPVLTGDRLVGIITRTNIVEALSS
jgi:CBS domain-containing protein